MSNPGRSLNSYIPHDRLLDLLGCSVRSLGLPARTRCPVCHEGILVIYDDRICGGAWHWCRRCGTSGDMIELAAKAWNLEIPAVVARMAREGIEVPSDPASLGRYQSQHVEYRQRLSALWDKSRDGLAQGHPAWNSLAYRLGMPMEDKWLTSPDRLLGAADRATVEEAFAPGAMQYVANRRRKSSPSGSAVLRGAGWEYVLVIPFFDLPNRISSFAFVGNGGDADKDVIIKRANRGFQGNQAGEEPAEAGLLFHPQVLDAAEKWDDTVFAVGDPFLALRLQARYARIAIRPLPLVAFYDTDAQPRWKTSRRTRTEHAWAMLEGRRVVFWMPTFDAATLCQAIRVGGSIATAGPRSPNPESLKQFCWRLPADELLEHIQAKARPWNEILDRELQQMERMAIEELLIRLEDEGHKLDELLQRCSRGTRQRVVELRSVVDGPKTAEFRGQTICESNNEWRVVERRHGQGELIVNAVLRIDAAVSQRRTGQIYYAGRILYRDHVVRFCEAACKIEKNPLKWMRDLLLQRSIGLLIINPDWTKKALAVAQLFHAVRVEDAVDAVGWDRDRSAFVFPQFLIHVGGRVEQLRYGIFPETPPAADLNVPEVLSGEELDRPARGEGTAGLFWATAAAVISNIVAPSLGHRPLGIATEGSAAVTVGELVAEALGCIVLPVYDAVTARKALTQECTHHWPLFLRLAPGVQRRHVRELLEAEHDHGRNCLIKVEGATARVLALRGGWHVIAGGRVPVMDRGVLAMARRLVPAYLQDLCERRIELNADAAKRDSFLEQILYDLANYVDRHHGGPAAVLSALDVLTPVREEPNPLELADLLVQQLREHRLRIVPEGGGTTKPALTEVPETNGLSLTEAALVKLLRPFPVDPPSPDVITEALAEAGALLEYRDDGWVIDRRWLDARRGQVERLRLLRVGC